MDDEKWGQKFMRDMELTMESEVVHSLISGNDTQCFTTKQYETARDEWIAKIVGKTREQIGIPNAPLEYARRQLAAFPTVVQVSPDVWTLKTLADQFHIQGCECEQCVYGEKTQ